MSPKAKRGKKTAGPAVAKATGKKKVARPGLRSKKAGPRPASSARAPKPSAAASRVAKSVGTRPKVGASSASLILNHAEAPAPQGRVPRKWARQHRVLCNLRDTLLEQSGRLVKQAHEEAAAYSMHMADSGTDSFDRDFALSLLSADQNALAEIEAAIQRIHTGGYGICEMTGRPISTARLEAIPWTRFSYEAQQQMEKSGLDSRVHLGSLRTVHGSDTAEPDEPEEEGESKPEPSGT